MADLVGVVQAAIGEAELQPRDGAAAALALKYAAAIDADQTSLPDVGPKLLAVLTALGMTPVGRGAKGVPNAVPFQSPLDELKARRATRLAGAQDRNTAAA